MPARKVRRSISASPFENCLAMTPRDRYADRKARGVARARQFQTEARPACGTPCCGGGSSVASVRGDPVLSRKMVHADFMRHRLRRHALARRAGAVRGRRPLDDHLQGLLRGPKERVSYILTWLNAYYRDDESPPVIDFDKMKADGEKLGAYCQKSPSVGIITAADRIFDK